MQLQLTFSTSSISLPINYRPLVHGAIYRAAASDPAATNLHDLQPIDRKNRPFKGFTFSPLQGSYTVDGSNIWFHNNISLEIRSVDSALINLLHRYFSHSGFIVLGTETITVSDCQITDTHLCTDKIAIQMISPAVAYVTNDHQHTLYFQPDDERFYAALTRNAERKNLFFQPHIPFQLCFRSLNDGLPRKQFSRFKKTYITAWFGRYLLEGTPEVIDLLYQTGIGAKNSEGFGLFAPDPPLNE